MPKKKKHTLIDKLSERFHILLVNEKTLEKRKLFSSSSINLAASSLFAFLLLLSTSFILIYITPLKEYFRGYTSIELMRGLGSGIKEFKKATKEDEEQDSKE